MAPGTIESTSGAKLTFGFTRDIGETEGFPVNQQQFLTMDLARRGPMGPSDVEKALVDAEIIASLLRDYPDEIASMFNHVVAGRSEEANEIAVRIGLTEERFQQQSGGMWVFIAFVGTVIVACAAMGGCPQTPWR